MKIRIFTALIALWSFTVLLEARPDTITGIVRNGSRADEVVPDQDVILTRYTGGQKDETFQIQTRTDSTGRFAFRTDESDSTMVYVPITTYAAVEYSGPGLPMTADPHLGDIMVYDTTSRDTGIGVPMHHILIEPGIDELVVKEIMLFENSSPFTYVGLTPPGEAKPHTLTITTFSGMMNMEIGGDLMSCCAINGKDRVYDSMEFQPGTRNIMVAYTIPYANDEILWRDTLQYATGNYDIFLAQGQATLTAERLGPDGISFADTTTRMESFQIRGQMYDRIHFTGLTKGDVLRLSLKNLPRKLRDMKILAPLLLVVVIAALTFWNRKGHQPD